MGATVTDVIIEAIAAAEDTTAVDLDVSLQEHVDTDAIRQLVEHPSDSWELRFDLLQHSVTVTGDGVVEVNGVERQTLP